MNTTKNARDSKISFIVMACVTSIFSVLCLNSYLRDVRLVRSAETWPQADGIVVSSQAVRGCGKGGRSYYPNVEYGYKVDGRSFAGNHITVLKCGCGSQASAESVASQYPAGSAVTVHYNPDNPAQSALVVHNAEPSWGGIVPLLGLMVLFITLAWKSVRDDRAASHA